MGSRKDIVQMIRTLPSDKINLNIGGKRITLQQLLKDSYTAVYGIALESAFQKYDKLVKYNTITNIAIKSMFEPFTAKFKKDYGSGKTKEWVDDWLEANQELIPNIRTSHRDSKPMAIVDTGKVSPRGMDASKVTTSTTFKTSVQVVQNRGPQKSMTARAIVKEFITAVSAGSVLPIHSIDGHNMSMTLNKYPQALGVHDALVISSQDATEVAYAQNKNFYAIHKEYSIFESLVKSFDHIYLTPSTDKDSTILVSKSIAEKVFGIPRGEDRNITMRQVREVLKSKLSSLQKARTRLFSEQLTLENLVLTSDSAYQVDPVDGDTDIYGSRGIKGKNKQLVMEFGFEDLSDVQKDNVVEEPKPEFEGDIKSTLPNRVRAKLNGSTKTYTIARATLSKSENFIDLVLKHNDTYVSFSFPTHGTKSIASSTGRYMYLAQPLVDEFVQDAIYQEKKKYGSREESATREEEIAYEELLEGLNTDTAAIVDAVDTLNEQTDNYTDEEVIASIKKVLGSFNSKYLEELSVFVSSGKYKETTGEYSKSKHRINLHKSRISDNYYNQQDLPVVYAHEVIHAFTVHALEAKNNTEASRIIRRLHKVYKQAAETVKVEDFLNEKNPNKEQAKREALSDYNYVFGNKNGRGLAEFIAYGMTNTKVIKKLKQDKIKVENKNQTLYAKILEFVIKLIESVYNKENAFKGDDKSLFKNLKDLSLALSESNYKVIKDIKRKPSWLSVVANTGNAGLVKAITFVQDKVKDDSPYYAKLPKNANRLERTIWMTKTLTKMATNPLRKGDLSTALDLMHVKPTGVLQNVIRSIGTPEEGGLSRELQTLGVVADNIDHRKKTTTDLTAASIHEGFGKSLTIKEDTALLDAVVDIDLVALESKYNYEEMKNLVINEEARDEEILHLEAVIDAGTGKSTWVKNQARGLGYYMVHHAAYTDGQNLNAANIQKGVLFDNRPLKTDLEVTIDTLATLYGLKYTNKKSVKIVGKLFDNKNGMENVLANLRLIKKESLIRNFNGDKTSMMKGYSVELTDPNLEVMIRPTSEKKEMATRGYKIQHTANKSPVTDTAKMSIYVSEDYSNNKYLRGATLLGAMMAKGTTLMEILGKTSEYTNRRYLLAKAKANLRLTKAKKVMATEDIYPATIDYSTIEDASLVPIINHEGEVKEFRYVLNKEVKRNILKQNTRASRVIGTTLAAIDNKVDRTEHNRDIMKLIAEDMAENFDVDMYTPGEDYISDNNGYTYKIIGRKVKDEQGRDTYALLPTEMQQFIDSYPEHFIVVRADMVHNYFGFRVWSLVGNDKVKSTDLVSPEIKKGLRLTGKIWEDTVSIAKTTITIKTPAVFLSNEASNTLQLSQMGFAPVEVLKRKAEMIAATTVYLKDRQALLKLELKVRLKTATKSDTNKILRLKESMKSNDNIHELFEAGFFSNIVEDVLVHTDEEVNSNLVSAYVDEKTEKYLDSSIKKAVDTLFVTKDTDLFQQIELAIQMSDFVARAVANSFYREQGMGIEKRHNRLRDDFVHYPDLYSPLEEYLNRMGIVMFTKYIKGVLRTLKHLGNEKPLYLALAMLGQELLTDVDDITDKNPLTGSFHSLEADPMGVVTTAGTPAWLSFLFK
jgi:hypothetical protein